MVHLVFTITEKAPTGVLSWLKAPDIAFPFMALLQHFAMLKLGCWHIDHKVMWVFSVILKLQTSRRFVYGSSLHCSAVSISHRGMIVSSFLSFRAATCSHRHHDDGVWTQSCFIFWLLQISAEVGWRLCSGVSVLVTCWGRQLVVACGWFNYQWL